MSKNKAYHERRKAKKQTKRNGNAIYFAKQLKLFPDTVNPMVYSMTKEKQVRNEFERYYIELAQNSGAQTKDRDALIEIGQTIERAA